MRLHFALWVARLVLAATLLSAVADRFGIWGPPGAPHVVWGDWQHFVVYCAKVNSFAPKALITILATVATALEAVFGLLLLAGVYLEAVAYASAILFSVFALAMTISFGPKAPLDYSVWGDMAAALLFAVLASYQRLERNRRD
jgi:putative oxidoreductase